jgi:arylsulfatase A-like enzyme
MSATEINTHQDGASTLAVSTDGARQGTLAPWGSPLAILLAAVTFGLATGLLELLLLVVRIELFEDGFFLRSTHFVWMVPLSDLAISACVGSLLAVIHSATGRRTMRGVVRILTFLACMSLLLLIRGFNSVACALLAGGIAVRAGPWGESCLRRAWPVIPRVAAILAVVLIALVGQALARSTYAGFRAKSRASVPPGERSNVILIVLDTVRADHLGIHGYPRDTTPNLVRLASEGVRFDRARATAPWTLPSHASLFTGRWPHELDVERLDRLDKNAATLAEFLRGHGYVTAGFVANPLLCGSKSGLARGFDFYWDYPLNAAEVFRASSLGWLVARIAGRLAGELRWCWTGYVASTISLDYTRKDAAALNREFLAWLASNGEKPFFAFLNYFDAHDPYLLPSGAPARVAPGPTSRADFAKLRDWQRIDKDSLSRQDVALARDAYDNCIAALDREVGRLIEELRSRRVLDKTLLIVTSDHGEQFGEHQTFGHGLSLYAQEINVPLLVIAPGRVPAGRVVSRAVSLHDVPATIVDFLGLRPNQHSPFPGTSLAALWREGPAPISDTALAPMSDLDKRIEDVPVPRNAPPFDGPLRAILLDDHVYIHHGSGAEELFNLKIDPGESNNLSGTDLARPILERCRRILDERNALSAPRPRETAKH